jgi:hypothetical protein
LLPTKQNLPTIWKVLAKKSDTLFQKSDCPENSCIPTYFIILSNFHCPTLSSPYWLSNFLILTKSTVQLFKKLVGIHPNLIDTHQVFGQFKFERTTYPRFLIALLQLILNNTPIRKYKYLSNFLPSTVQLFQTPFPTVQLFYHTKM